MEPDLVVPILDGIDFESLTGRHEVVRDSARLRRSVEDGAILVTGAAGSIGSQICRHLVGMGPERLVLFDQSESGLFRIEGEIRRSSPSVSSVAVLGDIRDALSVDDVVDKYAIDSIYHAAAYKHLPMMERHVIEAIRNNVLGTWNLVDSALRHGVGRMVLVSSDKAVNPTSVMGATKRLAESIVLAAGASGEGFASVRCGNVVGSVGSVVPLFREQIETGGPVTITDLRARRYFMSVREAADVLIEASAFGTGGQIFIPDMGEPVRIEDIAHRMIRLAGLTPDRDIAIRVTGLRAGEKIEEELIAGSDQVRRSTPAGVWLSPGPGVRFSEMQEVVAGLVSSIDHRDLAGAIERLVLAVPDYRRVPDARQDGSVECADAIAPLGG